MVNRFCESILHENAPVSVVLYDGLANPEIPTAELLEDSPRLRTDRTLRHLHFINTMAANATLITTLE